MALDRSLADPDESIIVIDEIGKVELFFRTTLGGDEQIAAEFQAGSGYSHGSVTPVHGCAQACASGWISEVTKGNRQSMPDLIHRWLDGLKE